MKVTRLVALAATSGLALTLAACGSDPTNTSAGSDTSTGASSSSSASGAATQPIVVGSASFGESEILAEIYAQALEAKGINASTHLDIGQREAYIGALKDGSISLFTSSGLSLLDGPPSLFSFDGTNVTRVDDGTVINGQLSGGRISALLNFRMDNSASGKPASSDPGTEVLRKLRSQLDMMASALTSTTGTPPTLAAAYNAAGSSQRVSASYQTTVQASASSAQFTTVGLTGTTATYYPDRGYAGTDTFTFAAWDGETDSNLGTATVTVSFDDTIFADGFDPP